MQITKDFSFSPFYLNLIFRRLFTWFLHYFSSWLSGYHTLPDDIPKRFPEIWLFIQFSWLRKIKVSSMRLRERWLCPLQKYKIDPCNIYIYIYIYIYKDVLVMILNCIWLWGSRFETLESLESPFTAITLRSTLIRSGNTS